MKYLLIFTIISFLCFMSCNNNDHDIYEQRKENDDRVFYDTDSLFSDYKKSRKIKSDKIDSVHIKIFNYYKGDIRIDNSHKGSIRLYAPRIDHEESLSTKLCEQIFILVDSIFMKKKYPVVVSREWSNCVTEALYPSITFSIYSGGSKFERTVEFGPVNGPYKIDYSDAFLRLKCSIIDESDSIFETYR